MAWPPYFHDDNFIIIKLHMRQRLGENLRLHMGIEFGVAS